MTLKIELEYITTRCKQLHVNITKLGITEGFKEKDLMTVYTEKANSILYGQMIINQLVDMHLETIHYSCSKNAFNSLFILY